MNRISFAITVCQERKEIELLLNHLQRFIRSGIDEIVVLFDEKNGSDEVREYLETIENITLIRANFDNDFAQFKNKLFSYCSKEYLFFLDADEIPNQTLIEYLPDILEGNPDVELFWIPRINLVRGIGLCHVSKWGWAVSKMDNYQEEKIFNLLDNIERDEYDLLLNYNLVISEEVLTHHTRKIHFYSPIINWSDHQSRICKNKDTIRYSGKVHETIQGAKIYSSLPADENLALYHCKQLSKQIKQNQLYDKL